MKLRTSIVAFSLVGLAGTAFLLTSRLSGQPDPQKEAALMQALMQGLRNYHFQPREINDDYSRDVYKLYLKDIDNGKRFFTKNDIDKLEKYDTQLDDQASAGMFDFFNLAVDLQDKALNKTQNWYREILAQKLDFSKNDQLETDGEKLEWAKNDAELRERWDKWMRYEVLNRIVEEQEKQEKPDYKGEKKTFDQLEEEQRKKVLDTYDKWFKRMQKADRNKRLEDYLNAFTMAFDPHTNYYSPKEKANFDIQMSGKLEGIGARLQSDGEKTTVSEIVTGGPAWKHGELQPKDAILKVAQGENEAESIDVMGWDLDDVVSKIRGPKGTRVTLTVQKTDGSIKVFTLTRDVVLMEEGFAKSLLLNSGRSQDKVGYIFLPKFYADFTPQGATSCAADVAKEIEKLKKEQVRGIILDLRGNGGGSLRDVVNMSGLFIEDGPVVQVKSRGRKPDVMGDHDNRTQWGGPLVVMVNGFSASASEILAAAMQDYKRAVIVGSTGTYGKGTVQRFIDLDNATGNDAVKPLGEMKLTIQKFYRISGKTTQLDGVTPDIVLPDFYNLIETGEKETDFPLASTTIDAVPFNQNAYRVADLDKIKAESGKRVEKDATFQKVADNAKRLRKQRDNSQLPLQLDKYRQWNKKQDEEARQFEDIFKPIEGFQLENLAADLPQIQADTARSARNDNWLKERKKDVQLYEALNILEDMIRMDDLAAGRN